MDHFDPSEYYAPPGEPAPAGASRSGPDPDLAPGPVLRRWERWRIRYNLALAVVTLLTACLSPSKTLGDPAFWPYVATCGIGANACFCAGPFAEAYLYWIGVRGRAVGLVLFVLGTMLAMFLAFGAVLLHIDPSFD